MVNPMILFFSVVVLAVAVDVSHERCPSRCVCPGDRKVECSGLNLTAVPFAGEATANLDLSDNQVTLLDLAFLRHYPNLQRLTLSRNNIRSLSKSATDYHQFFSLEHLDLSSNYLHVLHPYVLTGLPSVRSLNLSGNALHTVANSAFSLPSLEMLDLSGNMLEVIERDLFETSPKLNEINLSRNKISRLNDGTFGLITHLSILDLSRNSLIKIEDNVFVGMNITHLDLGFNALRRMPDMPLRKLTAVR